MNFKDVIPTCKEILSVFPKDDITKLYLSTKNKNYQYLLSCLDKKEFESKNLTNESLIQEFTFDKCSISVESTQVYNFKFSNICIGSNHFRDFHDFDLKVISKLAMLEFLSRTSMGLDLFKDIRYNEINLDFKKLEWSQILKKDKDFSGYEIKMPFVLALVIDGIKRKALEIADIFRKSPKYSFLTEVYKDLHKSLSSDTNQIGEIFDYIKNVEPMILCSVMKMLVQNFNPLFPINVLKYLYSLPDIQEPELVVLLYQCLMLQIPDPERSLLEAVIDLLSDVVEHESKNNLSLQSIATLFAPVLLNPDHDCVIQAIKVLIQMIFYRKLIFLIPRNVINQHRMDNKINKSKKIELKKNIGQKKSHLKINSNSVTLSHFKTRTDGDILQEEHVPKLTNDNIFNFKYKRRILSYPFFKDTITLDVIKTTLKEAKNSSEFRMYENDGNIHQSCLHPSMNLIKAMEDNRSAKFFIDLAPEYDLVESTIKSLCLYLKINVI